MTDSRNETADKLKKARSLIYDSAFEESLALVRDVLDQDPDSIDARYVQAVCERYLEQYDAALVTLSGILQIAPEFGRAYQEQGHVFRELGKTEEALTAYRQASRCNPALTASWKAQVDLLRSNRREQDAVQAEAQLKRVKSLPRDLLAVTNLIHEGKLQKAEDICRAYLQINPQDVEAMRLLAEIGERFGVYQDAEFLLESAASFEPENVQLRIDYIRVLRKRQKFEAALSQARHLYDQDPQNPLFQSHLAIESMQVGDHETAFEMFDRVLDRFPADPATLTSRGHALKTFGRQEEAVESYRAACRAAPDHGDAFHSLANLKTYSFSDDEIRSMEEQVSQPGLLHMHRIYFCFALGKAFESRKEYDRSFEYYQQGNDLKRSQVRYKPEQMTAELQAQIDVCSSELFEKHAGNGLPAPDPIFIVGLPRAGSTLLEQILASHSLIDGTLELPNILALSHRLRGRDRTDPRGQYPAVLHELGHEKLRDFGSNYIDETRIHRQGAPFFIDKMPNNFRHIGLIQLILPNAKIIDARRHPMDCCFSGFTQLFAEGQEFTYGLESIGQYYRDYVALMRHWDHVLPGKVLRVQYEDVVQDLDGQVRRILDYLGLPFEESCLEFHKTQRSVRTASSEQVRQPINRKGVDKWRFYERHLGPLKDALGPALMEYDK